MILINRVARNSTLYRLQASENEVLNYFRSKFLKGQYLGCHAIDILESDTDRVLYCDVIVMKNSEQDLMLLSSECAFKRLKP